MDKYKERKLNNLVSVEKVEGDELRIVKKQFDKDTGEEIASQPDTFLKTNLLTNKAELEAQLSDINELLKEFEVKK